MESPYNGAFCSLTSCSAIERGYSVAKTGELTPVAITAVTFPLLIDAAVNDNTILGSDETIKNWMVTSLSAFSIYKNL